MARYLDKQALQAKLNFGKEVEVFLGRDNEDKNIISFLVLRKQNEKIGIHHYQCFDEGGLDYLDIYSFSEVEGRILTRFWSWIRLKTQWNLSKPNIPLLKYDLSTKG